jgi:hypothetical protein
MAETPSAICDNCAVETPLAVLKDDQRRVPFSFFPDLKNTKMRRETGARDDKLPEAGKKLTHGRAHNLQMMDDCWPNTFLPANIYKCITRACFCRVVTPSGGDSGRGAFFFCLPARITDHLSRGTIGRLTESFKRNFSESGLQISIDIIHVTIYGETSVILPKSGNAAPYFSCVD